MTAHVETSELKKQMQAASAPHVRGIGEILLYLGQQNEQIAELIEQDLANREMSNDPTKNWHTVELIPGTLTVRQCRGYKNREATPEAQAFVDAWVERLKNIRDQRRKSA